MTVPHRWLNLAGVLLPFLGFVVAVVLLWNTLVDWSDLAVMLVMYVISGYGATLGFPRLPPHRSFQTFKPVEYTLAILGSLAVQGPVISWVADHRKHHAPTDRDGDPHPPPGPRRGRRGAGPAIRPPRPVAAAGCAARWRACGTRTWAGSSTSPARPSTPATRAICT